MPQLPILLLCVHVSMSAYRSAKKANAWAQKYADAYSFFDRWINSIEIIINGKAFEHHFQLPIVCDFVLGRTKEHIESTITINNSEDKARDFIKQCKISYLQTIHTQVGVFQKPPLDPQSK